MNYRDALRNMIDTLHTITADDSSKRVELSCSGELKTLQVEINELADRYQMAQETIRALNEQVRRNNLDAIMALIEALAAKDPYTRGHCERVSVYSLLLSESLGLASEEIDGVHIASFLHDVGKIGIPEDILNKPSRLTSEEYEQIKAHSSISSQIVSQIPNLSHIARIVLYHHERFDGTGYPDGLNGADIPLGSRILAIADSFDAMTSVRPYRLYHTPQEALQEIQRCAGTQFDPELSEVFVDAYANNYGTRIPRMHAS